MNAPIVVFIGGLLRHFLNTWITALMGTGFPYGILAINVIGSTAIGSACRPCGLRSGNET